MHLILPVGGQSSRFPNLRPKWMLTHPNGNLMIAECIRDWDLSNVDQILIVCLRQHEEQYAATHMLHKQFSKFGLNDRLKVIVIDQSDSQPHTVYQSLLAADVHGPILVKDSDNFFAHKPSPGNSICFSTISELRHGRVDQKSYVMMNKANQVLNIVEKRVISDTFCVGGYGFENADDFIATYEKIKDAPDLYISHVIYQMLLDGTVFNGAKVSHYLDWGTLEDWNEYRQRFCSLFIDLDGVLVENSAEYFHPTWGTTDAIPENVDAINQLYDSGYSEIILVTSRTQESEQITLEQLARAGVKYHRIMFGLMHAKRIMVNDYANSNPYRSCDAINILRDSNQLRQMLQGLIAMPENHL